MQKQIQTVLLFAFMLISGSAWAQQGNDIVYLKDGSFYRGTVIERVHLQELKMKTLDGRVITLEDRFVKKVSLNKGQSEKKSFTKSPIEVKKGYFNNTTIGLMIGPPSNFGYGNGPRTSFHTVNGIQKGKWSYGIGSGIDSYTNGLAIPLVADARFYLREKSHFSPFVQAQGGYSFGIKRDNEGDNPDWGWGWYPRPSMGSGVLGSVHIGFRKYTSKNFGYSFSIGERFHRSKREYNDYFWNGNEQIEVPVTEISNLMRTDIRFGIYFN